MDRAVIKQCSSCRYFSACIVGALQPPAVENFSNGLLRYTVEGSERAIFHQGEPLEGFYFLCSGVVKLVRSDEAGKEVLLDVIAPFAVLGSTPDHRQASHMYSALTITETSEIAYLSHGRMMDYFTRFPVLAQGMMMHYRKRLNKVYSMRSCLSLPVNARLLCVLGCIAPAFEGAGEAKTVILPLTQRDLAALIGATPETISRTLQRFAAEGIVKMEKKGRFTIDVQVLKDAASRQLAWMTD
jgi:CRP/FNR family transcriptional regulator